MKKVILGTGLLICCVLFICTSILKDAIYFTSANSISVDQGTDSFVYYAFIAGVIGLVFVVSGFINEN